MAAENEMIPAMTADEEAEIRRIVGTKWVRQEHGERWACLLLLAALDATRAERDKLQAFKDWVHTYLDGKGVPHHPPGTHGAEGCRIGDRMDWVFAEWDAARRDVESDDWMELLRKSSFATIPDVCRFIDWYNQAEVVSHWDRERYVWAKRIVAALPDDPICWPETLAAVHAKPETTPPPG